MSHRSAASRGSIRMAPLRAHSLPRLAGCGAFSSHLVTFHGRRVALRLNCRFHCLFGASLLRDCPAFSLAGLVNGRSSGACNSCWGGVGGGCSPMALDEVRPGVRTEEKGPITWTMELDATTLPRIREHSPCPIAGQPMRITPTRHTAPLPAQPCVHPPGARSRPVRPTYRAGAGTRDQPGKSCASIHQTHALHNSSHRCESYLLRTGGIEERSPLISAVSAQSPARQMRNPSHHPAHGLVGKPWRGDHWTRGKTRCTDFRFLKGQRTRLGGNSGRRRCAMRITGEKPARKRETPEGSDETASG